MFFTQHRKEEAAHEVHDHTIAELELRIESMQRETRELFEELGITPAQLDGYLAEPSLFHPKDWERLQEIESELSDRLACSVGQVVDHREVSKRRREQEQLRHWIPCR
jgi:hypothetical protein